MKAALFLLAGCAALSSHVRAGQNLWTPSVDASLPPQIRFTEDRATALVGRQTRLQLTIDPPQPLKLSLALQSSDPQLVYTPTVPLDVLPNASAATVTVWAVQASYSAVTVSATLLLDSMNGPSATITLDALNPRPVLNGIDPTSTPAGSPGLNLLVIGSQFQSSTFVSDSVVYWNGSPRPTRLVPLSICFEGCVELLYVSLSPADLASPGTGSLIVVNPAPGGGPSNEVTFQITPATRKRPKRPTQTVIFHDLLARKPIGSRH